MMQITYPCKPLSVIQSGSYSPPVILHLLSPCYTATRFLFSFVSGFAARNVDRRAGKYQVPAECSIIDRGVEACRRHLWAEALNLGAWDVLAKPFDHIGVIRSVKSAWQRWHDQTHPHAITSALSAAS
jgi:hypothetical protein